jgi:hypothetical protein
MDAIERPVGAAKPPGRFVETLRISAVSGAL